MIKFIAAIDSKRGMADDKGMPWDGKVPTDLKNFREKTEGHKILKGYGTYASLHGPLPNRENYVAKRGHIDLSPGFKQVIDAREFIKQQADEELWVIGGAGLYEQTMDLADELYLTQIEGDFHCTKFMPEFEDKFDLIDKSPPITENDTKFVFTTWRRKH